MTQARIIDENADFYAEMDPARPPVGSIPVGEVVETGKVRRRMGRSWVTVTRQGGQTGYILGDTHIFPLRNVELDGPADLYDKPGGEGRVIHQYKKKDRMMMLDVVRGTDTGWVKVKDYTGHKGYIPGKTRIRVLPDDLIAAGRKSMTIGTLWTVAGLALTAVSYFTAQSSSGMILIAWGAAIFGILQVVQGLIQYYNGKKDAEGKK